MIRPFTLYYAAATPSPTTNPALAFDVLELFITGSIAAIVAWILYRIGRWIAHL